MITSVASRTYLSKVQQTFRDLLNYLEIQQSKPEAKSYLEKSIIRITCNKDGLASIFLDHEVSKQSKSDTVKRFKGQSIQLCRQIVETLQSDERPFPLMRDKRFVLDKPVALELFSALQTYAREFDKEMHLDNGKLPGSKILTIYPSIQESEETTRRTNFAQDIKSVNTKLANEVKRMHRRKSLINKYGAHLSRYDLNFVKLTQAVMPKHHISMVESSIAKEDLLRYHTIATEIERGTLEKEYTNLLEQTRGEKLETIYQQILPLKSLVQAYWSARMELTKNTVGKLKSLEETLQEFSYKNF